tara:strand:+ start:99 stop:314 length:216 start_codon:yes stop_codon:yes gene_type:complete
VADGSILNGAQKDSLEKAPSKRSRPFGDKYRISLEGMGIVCESVNMRAVKVMMKGKLMCNRWAEFFEQYVK